MRVRDRAKFSTAKISAIKGYIFSFYSSYRSLKAKYRSLVIRKTIRAVDKNKQLPRISILEVMMMLKTAWDEVTEKTILNCFRKSGISVEAQTSAIMTMMTHLK